MLKQLSARSIVYQDTGSNLDHEPVSDSPDVGDEAFARNVQPAPEPGDVNVEGPGADLVTDSPDRLEKLGACEDSLGVSQ
jgi:hypothetical protein